MDSFARAWVSDYYEVREPRAGRLLHHRGQTLLLFHRRVVAEIELFRVAGASYGYVFYVFERLSQS